MRPLRVVWLVVSLCLTLAYAADTQKLAKDLTNPVAPMISVPFQFNYDRNIGADDIQRWQLNIQPVIPFEINDRWNLISRTIMPFVTQKGDTSTRISGIGDVTQSFFFSPSTLTESGWIWGAGPVLLLPTGKDALSLHTWGAGPTVVALKQSGGMTYGMLANHIWTLSKENDVPDLSVTFLQPFFSYTNADAYTYGLNVEASYNWKSETWIVPIHVGVSKVVQIGSHNVSFGANIHYWAKRDATSPEGIGFRFTATLLLPK